MKYFEMKLLLSGLLSLFALLCAAQTTLSIVEGPAVLDMDQHQITLSWSSSMPATSGVRYAPHDEAESFVEIELGVYTTEHNITLYDLEPASFYSVEVFVRKDSTQVFAPAQIFSTVSNSSGTIEVYFNQGVLASFSDGSTPAGTTPQEVEDRIIELINATENTLDISVYNTSRPGIVSAVKAAHNRGVRVRVIADQEASNSGWKNPAPPFPVVYGNDTDLMHNKFLIMDADDSDNCFLITGAMNLTYGNVLTDFNNTLVIQDQALALAYTLEFEEMWGSNGANPIPANARFGSQKLDNTPHNFVIGGVPVELYFSPSDGTTSKIFGALLSADTDLQFALLTLTKDELAGAILNRFQSGVDVRGIIENIDDWGGDFYLLQSQGVNVTDHPPSAMMHHKYGLIDATNPGSNPMVVTGSHNWTNRAEVGNDENTLLIFDASIANMYLQEFERMWSEVVATQTQEVANHARLYSYPNPASDLVWVEVPESVGFGAKWMLYDVHGRTLQNGETESQPWVEVNLEAFPAGVYHFMLRDNGRSWSQRLIRTW